MTRKCQGNLIEQSEVGFFLESHRFEYKRYGMIAN